MHYSKLALELTEIALPLSYLDESLLEVTVDDTGCLRRLGSVADGPLTDFISTGGEEGSEVQSLAHGKNDLGDSRLGAERLALLVYLVIVLETGKTVLEGCRHWDDLAARCVLLDPLGHLGEMLVLLTDVVFLAEVDEEDARLGSQEEEWVDDFDLNSVVSTLCRERWCCAFFEMEVKGAKSEGTSFHNIPALKEHQRAGCKVRA